MARPAARRWSRGYDPGVPIYEFRCGVCGERFEALEDAGTETAECRICGAGGATRVLSAPGRTPRLVKSGAAKGKQERANAQLRSEAKAHLAKSRRRGNG